jgi:hypothetical protein
MTSYDARLAAFADGRRLLRLRHPVPNDAAMACDACGSVEPRWLHLLKDEAAGRYALVGSNCVRALAELGVVRRRYAADIAEQAYADELTYRQVDQAPSAAVHQSPAPEPPAPPGPSLSETADGARLVAAVAMLQREKWATLTQALPLGADRWRFIALDRAGSGLEHLIVIGLNGRMSLAE